MNSRSVLILVIGILIAILLVIAGFVIPIFLTGGGGSAGRVHGREPAYSRTRRPVTSSWASATCIRGSISRAAVAASRGKCGARSSGWMLWTPTPGASNRVGLAAGWTGRQRNASPDRGRGSGRTSPEDEAWWPPEAERSRFNVGAQRGGPQPPPPTMIEEPRGPAGAEGIWTQAEPEAEFPAAFDEPGASSFRPAS